MNYWKAYYSTRTGYLAYERIKVAFPVPSSWRRPVNSDPRVQSFLKSAGVSFL